MVTAATWTEFQSASSTPWNWRKKFIEPKSNEGQKRCGNAVTSSGAESALTISR